MGREEEQNLMGCSDRGLREDCGGRCTSHDRRTHPSFFSCLRSRVRPVLPRLRPETNAREGLQPRTRRSAVQDRHRKDSREYPSRVVESDTKVKARNSCQQGVDEARLIPTTDCYYQIARVNPLTRHASKSLRITRGLFLFSEGGMSANIFIEALTSGR